MQTVDEQPETIHLYVVREEEPKPSVFPIVLSALSLVVPLVFCVLAPYQQPVTRLTLRVPAVLLPLKTFITQVAIIPTGVKVYPATTAHGILTITNGSVISQTIPQGFRLNTVITDAAVFVPAGSANGYGVATVWAHALVSGKSGNIPAYAINQVEGSSVYIRNLTAFSGGHDTYTVMIVTSQDRQTTINRARQLLSVASTGLHYPCVESWSLHLRTMTMAWRCQFVIYHIPVFYHVTRVRISGKNLLISVWFVPHPVRYWVK
jgi:hypothetical protein